MRLGIDLDGVVANFVRGWMLRYNLEFGSSLTEDLVNDWDAAKEALLQAVDTGHRKTRGRAAHNLAVVFEIEGNLAEAKEWAQAAWGRHKNKDSRDYLYDLNRRIDEVARVDQQLE